MTTTSEPSKSKRLILQLASPFRALLNQDATALSFDTVNPVTGPTNIEGAGPSDADAISRLS